MNKFSVRSIAISLALNAGAAALVARYYKETPHTRAEVIAEIFSALTGAEPMTRTGNGGSADFLSRGTVPPAFRFAGPSPGRDDSTGVHHATAGVSAAG